MKILPNMANFPYAATGALLLGLAVPKFPVQQEKTPKQKNLNQRRRGETVVTPLSSLAYFSCGKHQGTEKGMVPTVRSSPILALLKTAFMIYLFLCRHTFT